MDRIDMVWSMLDYRERFLIIQICPVNVKNHEKSKTGQLHIFMAPKMLTLMTLVPGRIPGNEGLLRDADVIRF